MIGQYLSNKNENTTVLKSKNFSDLNKPSDPKTFPKNFLDPKTCPAISLQKIHIASSTLDLV